MGAAIGLIIVLLHRIAKFEILQLLEKGEAAAAADPGLRQILRARRIGGRFLDAAEGEELAQRGLLARHHYAQRSDESRVGKGCVSTLSSRLLPDHEKKTKKKTT